MLLLHNHTAAVSNTLHTDMYIGIHVMVNTTTYLCVILIALPLQQCLHERASLLRYMYNSLISEYTLYLPFYRFDYEFHWWQRVMWEETSFQPCEKKYDFNLKLKLYTDTFHGIMLSKPVIKLWSKTLFEISYFFTVTSCFSFPRITLLLFQSCVMFGSTYWSKQMFLLRKRNKKSKNLRLWDTHFSLIMMTTSTEIWSLRLMIKAQVNDLTFL
jgi:hypothetical protein